MPYSPIPAPGRYLRKSTKKMPSMQPPTSAGETVTFRVRTYDIDAQKRMTLPALVRQMHEAAMHNVIRIQVSVWDLEPLYISWVLMRKTIELKRLPYLGEQLRIVTYPAGFERMFTYRDYHILDEQDEVVATAASTWVLMDTRSRKLRSIPTFLTDWQEVQPPIECCLPRPDFRLPAMKSPEQSRYFRIGYHDLDFNRHLSNVLYLQWMLETLPFDVLADRQPRRVDIQFKLEALHDEVVWAEHCRLDQPHCYLHRLRRLSNQGDLCSMRTEWQ